MKSSILVLLTGLFITAVAGSVAAGTTTWGPNPPGTYARITVNGTGSDFVVFTPVVTTTYAQNYLNSFSGAFTNSLTVKCVNGQTNSGSGGTFSGNVTVACPFFDSTIATASGSFTSL